MVQPAVGRSTFEHGVLAGHLVSKSGNAKSVFDPAHHIQIRHAGFDHHHIRAFGNIHSYFAQGLVAVGRVHLVRLFIAFTQVAGRSHGVAERAVKRAGVFGAVGHDAGVDQIFRFQRLADRADPPIHHVAGRHDVDPGLGLHQRLLHQHAGGLVIQDVALFLGARIWNAVLAVAGERVQRDIGHHTQIGELFFQRPHHARHQAIRVGGLFAVIGFE